MNHVNLGRTGLPVSRLCLGTMTFGNQCDEATTFAILDRALELGITFLDTADMYPATTTTDAGLSETLIGRWHRDRRADVIIATKFWAPMGAAPWQRGGSRRHIMEAVDGSLRRLGVEAIDLYQMHFPDDRTPIDETLGALDDLVRAGKVRYLGCSNFPAWRLALALGRSETRGWERFACVQPRYNLLFREMERELFPLCAAEGIGVIPYNPLAGGLLTGKHGRAAPEAGSRFTLPNQGDRYLDRYWHDPEHDAVEALRPLAAEAGVPLATLAVAWVLANPVVTAPIVGATRPDQLDDAAAAVGMGLDADLLARLDTLTRHFRRGDADR
jgi:aryl-alcohol dehydrogenase (NADP+)